MLAGQKHGAVDALREQELILHTQIGLVGADAAVRQILRGIPQPPRAVKDDPAALLAVHGGHLRRLEIQFRQPLLRQWQFRSSEVKSRPVPAFDNGKGLVVAEPPHHVEARAAADGAVKGVNDEAFECGGHPEIIERGSGRVQASELQP